MKLIDTADCKIVEPRRFEVIHRNPVAIVLRDNDRGKEHTIRIQSQEDSERVKAWSDNDWWNFLFLGDEWQKQYWPENEIREETLLSA